MMAILFGSIAVVLGGLSFIASVIRATLGHERKSHENEMGAIGWFILAALCFR